MNAYPQKSAVRLKLLHADRTTPENTSDTSYVCVLGQNTYITLK